MAARYYNFFYNIVYTLKKLLISLWHIWQSIMEHSYLTSQDVLLRRANIKKNIFNITQAREGLVKVAYHYRVIVSAILGQIRVTSSMNGPKQMAARYSLSNRDCFLVGQIVYVSNNCLLFIVLLLLCCKTKLFWRQSAHRVKAITNKKF